MIRIKVVFQGGGAKLVSLLAAAEILSELETQRKIEVVRVAGVSAGSIAAALLASGIHPPLFRNILQNEGRKMIRAFPSAMNRCRLYCRVARGKPIYPERELRSLLIKLFSAGDSKVERFKGLRKPLIVTASNVRNSEKIVYNSAQTPDQHLIDALVDSCALPFAFRTFKDNQLVVDGGISSNLPVDDLLAQDPLLPTLAIGFEPQAQHEIQSAASYGLALLGTAIDSATSVAVARVKASGGEAALLPHSFGTFEFERALNEGLSNEGYRELKARIREVLTPPVDALRSRSGALIPLADSDTITRVHADLMEAFPYSIRRGSTTVYANCLAEDHESDYPDDDVTTEVMEVSADGELLTVFKIGLAVNSYNQPIINREAFQLETLDGTGLSAEQVIVSEVKTFADGPGTVYSSLFFLKEPLRGQNPALRAVQHLRHHDSMIAIKTRGWDWLRTYTSKHHWPVYDNVILCPVSFGRLHLEDLFDHLAQIPEKETFNRLVSKASWVRGRPMTSKELAEHFPVSPPGYSLYGWRTNDLRPGGYCGCHISKRN